MRYSATSCFIKSIKRLPASRKELVKESIAKLVNLFETKQLPHGLGLKQLRQNIWEIRAELLDRIIFRKVSADLVEFIIVGTHDEVKKILKKL